MKTEKPKFSELQICETFFVAYAYCLGVEFAHALRKAEYLLKCNQTQEMYLKRRFYFFFGAFAIAHLVTRSCPVLSKSRRRRSQDVDIQLEIRRFLTLLFSLLNIYFYSHFTRFRFSIGCAAYVCVTLSLRLTLTIVSRNSF